MSVAKFDIKADTYDSHAKVQNQVAHNLLSVMQNMEENHLGNILDLGAGSGFLSEILKKKSNFNKIVSMDLSYNFLKINENPFKVNCDALKMPFKKYSFNTVLSSSAIHWIENFDLLLKEIRYILHEDGILAFNIFLKGTFSEMEEVCKITGFGNVLKMKTSSYYENLLIENGYEVEFLSEEKDTVFFDSVRKFLTSHRMTGASLKAKKMTGKESYAKFITYYNKLYAIKDLIPVSYNVGYFLCRKTPK